MSFTGYLRIRILNPDGTVIDPLPHPHESKWTVKFVEPGTSGNAAVGTFEVPLYPALEPAYKAFYSIYQQIQLNSRIEAYFTAIADPAGGPSIGSAQLPPGYAIKTPPKFSGIIRQLPTAINKYTLKGVDSLHLLHMALTNRTEYFNGLTHKLFTKSLTGYKLILGEDFSGTLGAWTNPAGWVLATDESMAVVKRANALVADGLLLSNASYPSTNYNDCVIDAMWDLNPMAATPGAIVASAGMVAASDSAGNNLILGQAAVRYVAANGGIAAHWEIDTEIWQKVAGSYGNTPKIRKTIVAWTPTNQFRCQVALQGQQDFPAAGNFRWTVLVNGVDSGCYWDQPTGTQSGQVGLRGLTVNGTTVYAGNFCYRNRGALMQGGKVQPGVKTIKQYFSRAPMLDLTQIAATTEGYVYRKNPLPGLFQDQVDFGPAANSGLPGAVGTDWQQFIRFEEGVNLIDLSLEPNAEQLFTDVVMALSSGADNAGTLEWHNIAAMKKYGILTELVSAQNVSDYLGARTIAQALSLIAGSPNTSKKASVYRDEFTEKWREGDFVDVHAPSIGINHQKMQIMEYTFNEGHDNVEIVFDKFSADATEVQLRRMWQTLDAIASGTAAMTPSSGSGIIYDAAYGAPAMVTAYSGFQAVDSTHNLRLRFTFPQFLAMVQKVTLSIFIMGFRSGLQQTAQTIISNAGSAHNHGSVNSGGESTTHGHGNPQTGGFSSDHSHNAGGETTNHNHYLHITPTSTGGGYAVQIFPADNTFGGGIYSTGVGPTGGNFTNNVIQNETSAHGHGLSGSTANHSHAQGATGGQSVLHIHTSGSNAEASHSHTIPAMSLSLPASLYETGSASNVNVIIDGTNVTGALGGPFSVDQNELDITPFIIGGGIHDIQLTTGSIGGLIGQVNAMCLVKSQ